MKTLVRVLVPAASLVALLAAAPRPVGGDDLPEIGVGYLEIVTPEVDATVALLSEQHGVTFSEPIPAFGNARTAPLKGGGRLAVRAPMHELETPVVRPYLRVEDAKTAYEAALAAKSEGLHPALAIPGEGTFAIHQLGGIQHGVWQD